MSEPDHLEANDVPQTAGGPRGSSRVQWIGLLALVVALGAIWYWQNRTVPTAVDWEHDADAAFARAAAEGRPVLLKFYLHGCAPCAALDGEVFADAEIGREVNASCVPLSLDLQQERRLSGRYGVGAAPTLLVLSPSGDVLAGPANPGGSNRRAWFEQFLQRGLARWREQHPAPAASQPAGPAAAETRGATAISGGASEKVSDTLSPERETVSDTAPPETAVTPETRPGRESAEPSGN